MKTIPCLSTTPFPLRVVTATVEHFVWSGHPLRGRTLEKFSENECCHHGVRKEFEMRVKILNNVKVTRTWGNY
jgi:hypothetical protein